MNHQGPTPSSSRPVLVVISLARLASSRLTLISSSDSSYIGCFSQPPTFWFTTVSEKGAASRLGCSNACRTLGAQTFGLSNETCACGVDLPQDLQAVDNSTCSNLCPDFNENSCGDDTFIYSTHWTNFTGAGSPASSALAFSPTMSTLQRTTSPPSKIWILGVVFPPLFLTVGVLLGWIFYRKAKKMLEDSLSKEVKAKLSRKGKRAPSNIRRLESSSDNSHQRDSTTDSGGTSPSKPQRTRRLKRQFGTGETDNVDYEVLTPYMVVRGGRTSPSASPLSTPERRRSDLRPSLQNPSARPSFVSVQTSSSSRSTNPLIKAINQEESRNLREYLPPIITSGDTISFKSGFTTATDRTPHGCSGSTISLPPVPPLPLNSATFKPSPLTGTPLVCSPVETLNRSTSDQDVLTPPTRPVSGERTYSSADFYSNHGHVGDSFSEDGHDSSSGPVVVDSNDSSSVSPSTVFTGGTFRHRVREEIAVEERRPLYGPREFEIKDYLEQREAEKRNEREFDGHPYAKGLSWTNGEMNSKGSLPSVIEEDRRLLKLMNPDSRSTSTLAMGDSFDRLRILGVRIRR